MIYIDRNRTDSPGNLIKPNEAWFQRAKRATEKAELEMGEHKTDRTVYAHQQVRMALEKLFHEKCAYCESELKNVDWDVEHFLPKGRVAERPNHPGYYWLAYEWTNFYPACQFCNQRRRDKPRWGDLTFAGVGGKADQFPLADESTRVMSHHDQEHIAQEQALLLDPCADYNQDLRFDPMGQIDHKNGSQKGQTTIEVCFLKRTRLRYLRKGILDQLIQLLTVIQRLENDGHDVTDLQNYLQKHFLADSCQYAALSRYVLNHPDEFGFNTRESIKT